MARQQFWERSCVLTPGRELNPHLVSVAELTMQRGSDVRYLSATSFGTKSKEYGGGGAGSKEYGGDGGSGRSSEYGGGRNGASTRRNGGGAGAPAGKRNNESKSAGASPLPSESIFKVIKSGLRSQSCPYFAQVEAASQTDCLRPLSVKDYKPKI